MLESAAQQTELYHDAFERQLARDVKSGDSIKEYPRLYELADHRFSKDHEHFIGAYRYVVGNNEAEPPEGCEILVFDSASTNDAHEGEGGYRDFALLIDEGVVCMKRYGESLQH